MVTGRVDEAGRCCGYRRRGLRELLDRESDLSRTIVDAFLARRALLQGGVGARSLQLSVWRGSLDRPSLRLFAQRVPDQARRMAWLATCLPRLSGSGTVYRLTVRDAIRVAAWLRGHGLDAEAYYGDLDGEN